MNNRSKQLFRLVNIVIMVLAVGIALWTLFHSGMDFLQRDVHLDITLVSFSFLVYCVGLGVAIIAWRRILTVYGIRQPIHHDVRMYSYSALAVMLPGGIWSILSRSALYMRRGVSGLSVAIASIVEALAIGVAGTMVYAVTSVFGTGLNLWQRPEVGLVLIGLSLVLVQPRVFNGLIKRIWKWSGRASSPPMGDFKVGELAIWLGLEMAVILIGGIALFILLDSFTTVPSIAILYVISSWAVAAAAGNLLFWLPGTFILRDGALVIALTSVLPVSVAILFAVIARLWSIAALLLTAGLVWLIFDLPYRVNIRHDSLSQ